MILVVLNFFFLQYSSLCVVDSFLRSDFYKYNYLVKRSKIFLLAVDIDKLISKGLCSQSSHH